MSPSILAPSKPRSKAESSYKGGPDWWRLGQLQSSVVNKGGAIYTVARADVRETARSSTRAVAEAAFSIAQSGAVHLVGLDRWLNEEVFARVWGESTPTSDLPDWLAAINRSDAPIDLDGISLTVDGWLDSLESQGPDAVRELLEKVDVAQASSQHLLATLRTLFAWRDCLPEWEALRARGRAALQARDLNVDVLMRGLEK